MIDHTAETDRHREWEELNIYKLDWNINRERRMEREREKRSERENESEGMRKISVIEIYGSQDSRFKNRTHLIEGGI